MHRDQEQLLQRAESLRTKLAAALLWKYTDPDNGKIFYLTEKVMTIRSPYTGKTFSTKPERYSLSDVGQELREEAKK